jgi:ActR/RegA family two-component response regulator
MIIDSTRCPPCARTGNGLSSQEKPAPQVIAPVTGTTCNGTSLCAKMAGMIGSANIKPSLLIVDDDPLILDSLGFALESDFAVTALAGRAEAIDWVRAQPQPPLLALIDLGLPPVPHRPDQGYALIADLLNHVPTMRIIVLSGQDQTASGRHARALGATDFVAKPADPSTLRAILQRALALDGPQTESTPVRRWKNCACS